MLSHIGEDGAYTVEAEAIGRGWANRDASIALTLQEERAGVKVRLPPD